MKIELSEEEFQLLIYALGLAAGSVTHQPKLFNDILRLANTVNANNLRWIPYEVKQ